MFKWDTLFIYFRLLNKDLKNYIKKLPWTRFKLQIYGVGSDHWDTQPQPHF